MVAGKRGDNPLNTVIVGGGAGCEAILHMVEDETLGDFRMLILGVADIEPEAPGMLYARQVGIERVTSDYRDLLEIEDLDLILELTGRDEVRNELERARPPHVNVIGHAAAHLFWELHQAQQAVLRQRTETRLRVEEERRRISQIFDSIPDEVLVLDTDMVIQQANASFLRNNDLRMDDIRGRLCYEVEQSVRGECQVALENCPCSSVLREGRSSSVVRKHFGPDGKARFSVIVAAPIQDEAGVVTGMVEMTREITHRIRLEEELKASEVRLQQFMETAPLPTYVKNRQGQYIDVNPAACELFGLPKGEVLGRTDLEILPREAADVLRHGDAEVLRSGRQQSFDAEITIRGERVFLSTFKYPLLDMNGKPAAVVGLSNDVTAQREAKEALRRTREYLQQILANSPLMILTTDLEGAVVSFNREAEISLGYSADEIIGTPAGSLFREPTESDALRRRVRQEGVVHEHETTLIRRDGEEVPASLTLSQLRDPQGEMLGAVVIARNISGRKALMDQIIQSERLAAVGRLAAGVGHEINNPLAVIGEVSGYLEDLVKGLDESVPEPLRSELLEGLPKIRAQIGRGRSITARLLSFARKSEARVEAADVNGAVDEILPFMEKQARLGRIAIECDLQPDLPRVAIEELQLEEVLLNLITNSIQAMSNRGHGKIRIQTREENAKVVVTVADDGPGIDEEIRDRLFDPFVSTKAPGQGTGLGLSICYGIVKRYDGEIRVESRPGEGATFRVVLPVHRSPHEEPTD